MSCRVSVQYLPHQFLMLTCARNGCVSSCRCQNDSHQTAGRTSYFRFFCRDILFPLLSRGASQTLALQGEGAGRCRVTAVIHAVFHIKMASGYLHNLSISSHHARCGTRGPLVGSRGTAGAVATQTGMKSSNNTWHVCMASTRLSVQAGYLQLTSGRLQRA